MWKTASSKRRLSAQHIHQAGRGWRFKKAVLIGSAQIGVEHQDFSAVKSQTQCQIVHHAGNAALGLGATDQQRFVTAAIHACENGRAGLAESLGHQTCRMQAHDIVNARRGRGVFADFGDDPEQIRVWDHFHFLGPLDPLIEQFIEEDQGQADTEHKHTPRRE